MKTKPLSKLAPNWTQLHAHRFVRTDGAVVQWDDNSPYPNPQEPGARMWTAWEPDPSEKYIASKTRRGHGYPRRWKHPYNAISTIDRLFPLEEIPIKKLD